MKFPIMRSIYLNFDCSQQVSIYLQNWNHVIHYISKAEQTPEYVGVINFMLSLKI